MVPTIEYEKLVRTQWIQTQVSGPKPCNNLAFIRCQVPGKAIETGDPDVDRWRIRFTTDFVIKNVDKNNRGWYQENTCVSAAAFIEVLNASDDTDFVFAVEAVEADISQDGNLVFETQMAMQSSTHGVATTMDVVVTAYVLLYEPRAEPTPPSGNFGQRLNLEPIRAFGKKRKIDASQMRKLSA